MKVVQITHDDDGRKVDFPAWCYIMDWSDSDRTLCGGHVFGYGEGSAQYKLRDGNVTCKTCRSIIKQLKEVKL
jgi:hypothetical protein